MNKINQITPIKYIRQTDKLKEATDKFEAIYVKKMLEIAYKDSSLGGEGPGKDIIKGMYLDELSKSSNGAFGISSLLYKNLHKDNINGQ